MWRGRHIEWATLRRVLRVGLPAAAEQVVFVAGFLMFSVIGLQLGTVSYAAQNVIGTISSIAYFPAFGLGVATSALVGQSLGARRPDLAWRFGHQAALAGLLLSAVFGGLFVAIPGPLLGLFVADPAVVDASIPTLRLLGAVVPAMGPLNTYPGALRGAGDTRATFVIALVSLWLVRLPIAWGVGLQLQVGLFGLWIGGGTDFCFRALVSYLRFASGKWQHIQV
ncbi:MAG: hypothetical protein FJ029_00805, partial [Actinobacteria bacterium]|nr:hypothetical protein [Actinomycetota bacterium]